MAAGPGRACCDNARVSEPVLTPSTPPTPSSQSSGRRGSGRSVGGMAGALLASMALIAAVWGLTLLQHRGTANPTPTVSYQAALAEARSEASFAVVAPMPQPAGIRATSVSWSPIGARKLWHLGFLTGDDQYIGLYEGTGQVSSFVSAHTPATVPGVPVSIAGARWRTFTDSAGETAFVHTVSGVTTLVTGTAPRPLLLEFVSRLR